MLRDALPYLAELLLVLFTFVQPELAPAIVDIGSGLAAWRAMHVARTNCFADFLAGFLIMVGHTTAELKAAVNPLRVNVISDTLSTRDADST